MSDVDKVLLVVGVVSEGIAMYLLIQIDSLFAFVFLFAAAGAIAIKGTKT